MQLTDANLRYLLTIYELSLVKTDVSSQAVASALGVSKPSVTHVLDALMRRGVIVKQRYGKIYLTDRGVLAARYYTRLVEAILADFPETGLFLTAEERRLGAIAMAAALPCVALRQRLRAIYEEENRKESEEFVKWY